MYRVNSLETYSMTFNYKKVIIFVVFFKKLINPKFTANKKQCMSFKVHQFLSSSNFLKHIPIYLKVTEGIQSGSSNNQTTLNTLWHGYKENSQSELKNM